MIEKHILEWGRRTQTKRCVKLPVLQAAWPIGTSVSLRLGVVVEHCGRCEFVSRRCRALPTQEGRRI
jgi:hypothetical protein